MVIYKRTKPNRKSIEIAETILTNNIYVHRAWQPVTYKGGVSWNEDPYSDITWCFYLHSLDIISYLTNAYELEKNQEYLLKSVALLESWYQHNPSKINQASPSAWKDHSTANRVINLIYFWEFYKNSNVYDQSFGDLFHVILERHGEFLYDEENYTKNNNHGIFQAFSLIELSILFPKFENSQKWYVKSIGRLLSHVTSDVSPSGVHKEHSGAYHIVVYNLFRRVNEFLEHYGKSVPELSSIVIKMEDHLAYIVKPDGKIPMTGDSGPDSITSLNIKDIRSAELLYVRTNYKRGKKPLDSIVYPDSGIAIFRNGWTIKKPVYLLFTAAFNSITHKHADDLSILLSVGKTDFLVDSGKYNYKEKDEYRRYFRSSLAHNTITVGGKTYLLTKSQIGKVKIDHYHIGTSYSIVSGIHTLYEGVQIKRTIIYLKEYNSILIRDQMESSEKQKYSLVFNIGENVIVKQISKRHILLKSKLEDTEIELLQLNHFTEFKNYYGETSPIRGWQSSAFNQKIPIQQLQFSKKGDSMEYKTIVNVDLEKGIKNFKIKNDNILSVISKSRKKEVIQLK